MLIICVPVLIFFPQWYLQLTELSFSDASTTSFTNGNHWLVDHCDVVEFLFHNVKIVKPRLNLRVICNLSTHFWDVSTTSTLSKGNSIPLIPLFGSKTYNTSNTYNIQHFMKTNCTLLFPFFCTSQPTSGWMRWTEPPTCSKIFFQLHNNFLCRLWLCDLKWEIYILRTFYEKSLTY